MKKPFSSHKISVQALKEASAGGWSAPAGVPGRARCACLPPGGGDGGGGSRTFKNWVTSFTSFTFTSFLLGLASPTAEILHQNSVHCL